MKRPQKQKTNKHLSAYDDKHTTVAEGKRKSKRPDVNNRTWLREYAQYMCDISTKK